jgi:hypothetical protein
MLENQNHRMEEKPARLTILIDAEKKRAFENLCASQDITASQVVRQLIREYVAKHAAPSGNGLQLPPAQGLHEQ